MVKNMENNTSFLINNLSVSVNDQPVLNDISLSITPGSIHAIMGPNGSGKSSLAYALMGHPHYKVRQGTVEFDGVSLLSLMAHERAKKGLFLSFQNPCEIPGVSVSSFLKEAYSAIMGKQPSVVEFNELLLRRCAQLSIDPSFISRGLNDGFSGGEKKRLELLQLLMLQPQIAILDEIDSGLDIDALKMVAEGIQKAQQENPTMSIVIITHYRRILEYIHPEHVHVLYNSRIVASGNYSLVTIIEAEGYDAFK
jgi:Fe-S cluster assembly ATP-binding protein